MNEEEIKKIIEMTINKSNKEYISLKKQFEELRNDYIELARSEEQLENNWNELKKWLEEDLKEVYRDAGYRHNIVRELLDEMQELEGNNE